MEAANTDTTIGSPAAVDRWRWLAYASIAIGVAVRGWQYAGGASIWVDEATIARNILDRGLIELLARPLDYGQFAPPLFLALVDASTHLFGISELSVRLLPFVTGVVTLPVFHAFARRMLPAAEAVLATLLVATAVPLILFSANLKQYAPDVLAVVGIALLAAGHVHRPLTWRRALLLILAGLLTVGVSSGAVFMLVPAGVLLAWSALAPPADRPRRPWRLVADWPMRMAIVAGWALATGAAVAWSQLHTTDVGRVYMDLFWARGFVPRELSRMPEWFWASLRREFGGTGGAYSGTLKYAPEQFVAALFLVGGIVTAWRRVAVEVALLLAPIALALAAALAAVYPFRGRVILFLLPLMLILVVRGAASIAALATRRYAPIVAAAFLLPIAVHALWENPLPQDEQRMRGVMAYLYENVQPGDRVWVYYGAGPAYGYYAHRFPVPATVSDCSLGDSRSQIAQVDRLRGSGRAWVVISHAGDDAATDERTPLLNYLDAIGQRLDAFPRDFSNDSPLAASAALLYRLDDPVRLAQASATTTPVPPSRRPAWGCFGSMTYDEHDMTRAAHAVMEAAGASSKFEVGSSK